MIGDAFDIMRRNPMKGCLCEFGVWQGGGLEAIATLAKNFGFDSAIYGFDSFEGMPPTEVDLHDNHKIVWRPGGYNDTSVQAVKARVPNAHLVKAVFSDLKPLADYGIDGVRFARIDCDIYEGYRDALRLLTPHIQKGTVLLFDEGIAPDDERYKQSIMDSGVRAIREWQEQYRMDLHTIKSQWTECLTVVQ